MWFTIGFTAACVAGVYFVSGAWLLALGVVCLAALIGAACMGTTWSRKIACVCFGCVIGFLWLFAFDKWYLQTARQMDGQTSIISIEVTEYSRITDTGIFAEGKVKLEGKTYRVQFYLNEQTSLSPGDLVEGGFTLR